jgi:hypothetical protein
MDARVAEDRVFRGAFTAFLWAGALLILNALAYIGMEPEVRVFSWWYLLPLAILPSAFQASKADPWAFGLLIALALWLHASPALQGVWMAALALAVLLPLFLLGLLASLGLRRERQTPFSPPA